MTHILVAQLGGHVPIQLTARELRSDNLNGQRADINGIRFTSIKDPAGDALDAGDLPTWHLEDRGRFVAHLDTSGLSAGEYECQIEVGLAFSAQTDSLERQARKDFILRLQEHSVP